MVYPVFLKSFDSHLPPGFLNMGNGKSRYLYENQYIAPLMGGFEPPPAGNKPQDVRHFSNCELNSC